MAFIENLIAQRSLFVSLNEAALRHSTVQTRQRCNGFGNTPQEPDFIAGLTLDYSQELYRILMLLFPKTKFSIYSVYCHQKPLADFGASCAPEIGDILFVFISNGRKKQLNSLLFQAKITQSENFWVEPRDLDQLALYAGWPKFKYKRAGSITGMVRDILPKTITTGAQYLLIDNHPIYGLSGLPGTFPFGTAIPDNHVVLSQSLAIDLFDFFQFKNGRPFEAEPAVTNDHWTKMIWDLIGIARDKTTRRIKAGLIDFPRLTEHLTGLSFTAGDLRGHYSEKYTRNERATNDNEGAISLILVESFEAEG